MEKKVEIKILGTSDVHGRILPWNYAADEEDNSGSYAQISTYVKKVRENNKNVLFMEVGDAIQDNWIEYFANDKNHPVPQILNYMKCDIFVPGNHEFNFGMPTLTNILKKMKAKKLLANLFYNDENKNNFNLCKDKKRYLDAATIIEKDGVKIGIIGLGTVGEGVLKVLTKEKESIFEKSRADIEVKYACDLNINRDFSFDFDKSILINDYKKILADPEVKIVVELIGGETIAKTIITESFKAKKSVVTANKALIAKHGVELFQIAKENGVSFLFEAAVGGGIPIVTPLMESLVANTVTEIKGIMNGTSNYILTKMKEENLSFEEALSIASAKGYAEADPTYDVDGIDAGHKINILASLAYGGSIKFKDMQISGIREINTLDIFSANQLNSTIKLIASSKLISEDSAQISVEPVLISNGEILAKVDDVYNAIETTGSYTDKTLFYGKGAGMDPTASAVVADIVKIVTRNHIESDYFFNSTKVFEIVDSNTVKDSYYIRVSDDFDIENSPFELINQIENYYIILANNISKNEINEILKNAKLPKEVKLHD